MIFRDEKPGVGAAEWALYSLLLANSVFFLVFFYLAQLRKSAQCEGDVPSRASYCYQT